VGSSNDRKVFRAVRFFPTVLFFFATLRLCVSSLLPAAEVASSKPFRYTEARIPNYLPNAAWGTLGEDLTRMQLPVSPAESLQHMVLPDGLRAEIFAAEPAIGPPLALAWDDRGRLFLAESVDYPNEGHAPAPGSDCIRMAHDSDGDGRADRFTRFAEDLSIPTSILFVGRGLVVAQAPEMLYFEDTDGDDRADVRRVLFSGWGTSDTHAGPSNLRRGLDNWIWGTVGYAGFDGTVGGTRWTFRQGIFRFRPDGSELEFLGSTSNNTWGLGFSEEGHVFASTANGQHSVQLTIPNRYYDLIRGASAPQVIPIADHERIHPITDRVRQVDWHGRFTAAAGCALYTARRFPEHYWNRAAFVAEPTGHLVHQCFLESRGADRCDFVARDGGNLLASDDEWTAPIAAEVGPDGAVWVIDWYNYIVQHNPTPRGFETGKGNAYATPLRDQEHGRIYRVFPPDAMRGNDTHLDGATTAELVRALRHENMFWRLAAQWKLVTKGSRDAVPALIELVRDQSVDVLNLNVGAVHALWTLHGLGLLDEVDPATETVLAAAVSHPSAAVRKAAFDVLPSDSRALELNLPSRGLEDPSPHVRLAALLALARMPESPEAGRAVWNMLTRQDAPIDRTIADGATSAGARHHQGFLAAVLASECPAWSDGLRDVVRRVSVHHGSLAQVEFLGELVAQLHRADPVPAGVVIEGLAAGWPHSSQTRRPELAVDQVAVLRGIFPRLSVSSQVALLMLADRWGLSDGLDSERRQAADQLARRLADPTTEDGARQLAAENLAVLDSSPETARRLVSQLDSDMPSEQFESLVRAIALSRASQVGDCVIERWREWTPSRRRTIVSLLLKRPEWAESLIKGLEQGNVSLADLSVEERSRLAGYPQREIAEHMARILSEGEPTVLDRGQLAERLLPLCAEQGDIARGKEIFQRECAKCHEQRKGSPRVGPDLSGFAAHPKPMVLSEILDPNRSVEGNYRQYTVVMDDGRVLAGILAAESRNAIELIDSQAVRHMLQRDEMESILASTKSLMPEGFESLPRRELVDLLEYLNQGGRYVPLSLEDVATVASDRGMFYDESSVEERLVFPDWKPKAVEGVPFRLIDPLSGARRNVILLHSSQGTIPPRMPRSVSVPCGLAARTVHFLSGVAGWGHPLGDPDSVSLVVRFHYVDGEREEHRLLNGRHFADYIRRIDVPGSKLAFRLGRQQIRYFALEPARRETIQSIELEKGTDQTAPIIMAITAEQSSPHAPREENQGK
jgi:putative membrane-bound dehydrogenase-like protein